MYTFKYHHCINMWIISLLAIPIKIFIKSSPLSSVFELHTYMYRLKSHASMVKLFEPKILEALFNNDGILQIPWIRPSDGWFARHSKFGSDKNLSNQQPPSLIIRLRQLQCVHVWGWTCVLRALAQAGITAHVRNMNTPSNLRFLGKLPVSLEHAV